MAPSQDNDMTYDDGTYQITKLRGSENFFMWKIRMRDILVLQELDGYAEGSLPAPAIVPGDKQSELALERWQRNDQNALAEIRLRVAYRVLPVIVSAKTSKEAWDELASKFGPTRMSMARLRRKLITHTIPEGADVTENVSLLCGYHAELKAFRAGAALDDMEFAYTLLLALPASWDAFAATIIATDGLKTDTLVPRILAADYWRKSRTPSDHLAKSEVGQ